MQHDEQHVADAAHARTLVRVVRMRKQ
jgi:hypothetical protein